MSGTRIVSVALGVIANDRNQVLLLRRPGNVHQGNLWAFPGGKIEKKESPVRALHREIHEETGLVFDRATSLITIDHNYTDRFIRLHVYLVKPRRSRPLPRTRQRHRWTPLGRLNGKDMPAANRGIIRALRLPPAIIVASAGQVTAENAFFPMLASILGTGVRLLYLRGAGTPVTWYVKLAKQTRAICDEYQTTLMLDGRYRQSLAMGRGLHLPTDMALRLDRRPVPESRLLSVACHNHRDLRAAIKLNADFVYLSPVRPTASHPGLAPIGWKRFASLVQPLPIPAYALGGMRPTDLPTAWRHRAQGIALHSAAWQTRSPCSAIHACLRLADMAGRPR